MNKIRWIAVYINFWRVIPAYMAFSLNKFKTKCKMDLDEWVRYSAFLSSRSTVWKLGYFLIHSKECRNIFLNRLHRNPILYIIIRFLFRPMESCYINMPPERIGGGFSFQHGFSTIVAAEEIGERCRIFQQVTVGFHGEYAPVIGNDVKITAGSIIIGKLNIGNNSMVGAGAVVVHDVPENAIVAGVPAKVLKFVENEG